MTLLYVIETVPWTNETNSKNRVEYPNVCPNTESDVINTPTKTSVIILQKTNSLNDKDKISFSQKAKSLARKMGLSL